MISAIVESKEIFDRKIRLENKREIHHLKDVMRVEEGKKVRLIDGEKSYICLVEKIEKKAIEFTIIEEKIEERSDVEIHLAMGILKNDKMELSIQKLTELGVDKIIPTLTKRVVAKVKKKKEKWDTISFEALKQCQGSKKMEIDEPKKLKEIGYGDYDLVLVPYEQEKKNSLKEELGKIDEKEQVKKILYLIGPEGGFEESEIKFLQEKNAKAITLGSRILRAETAIIVVGGILTNEFK